MRVERLVKLALLSAMSLILAVWVPKFPVIPTVPFLEYDFADVPILIGTFMFGPVSGLAITAIVSLLQAAIAASTGFIGAAMHFFATGAMVLAAGSVYKKFHTLKGAIVALVIGALTMTAVMIPLNLLLTPLFLGTMEYSEARKVVWGLMPSIIAFNAIKAFGNSAITFALYKSISKVLKQLFKQES